MRGTSRALLPMAIVLVFAVSNAEAHVPRLHPEGSLRTPLIHHINYLRPVTNGVLLSKCRHPHRIWGAAYKIPEALRRRAIVTWATRLSVARSASNLCSNPVALGRLMAATYGWTGSQWLDLYDLWNHESGWDPLQWNRGGSGACGIPQALPCSKMCGSLSLSQCSARRQIAWGLRYIQGRYRYPSRALDHLRSHNWY